MLIRIATMLLLFTVAATAAEVECPPTSPAGAKLLGGYPEPDNSELTEQLERRGDRWHLVQNLERFAFALISPNRTYINLELEVLTSTRSVAVARLYMILAQYAGRRDPVFRAEIPELCDRLGIPADSAYRRNGGLLKAKVIEEAVGLINERSGFRVVRIEYTRGTSKKPFRISWAR